MKKIVILQFRTNTKTISEEQVSFLTKLSKSNVEIVFKNAFQDDLNWNNPEELLCGACGIILGGSGEFDFDGGRDSQDVKKIASHSLVQSIMPFLKHLERTNFPTLAICFGHQIIARSLGVHIINDKEQTKVGSHQVSLTNEGRADELCIGLPNTFVAQYGHKDSLSSIPSGAVLLAKGDRCLYSAIRFGKNRYGVQFHPELNADEVRQKFLSHPDYLPEGLDPEDLIQESPHATTLLTNFINNI